MDVVNQQSTGRGRPAGPDLWLGWTAVATSAGAVLASAACCVLPMALALAGIGMTATSLLAGQRSWLTATSAVILAIAWVVAWRRTRACGIDGACAPPSRLNLALLFAASLLLLAVIAWPSLIEPAFVHAMIAARR